MILCTKPHVGQKKRPRVREELWTKAAGYMRQPLRLATHWSKAAQRIEQPWTTGRPGWAKVPREFNFEPEI